MDIPSDPHNLPQITTHLKCAGTAYRVAATHAGAGLGAGRTPRRDANRRMLRYPDLPSDPICNAEIESRIAVSSNGDGCTGDVSVWPTRGTMGQRRTATPHCFSA